MQISEEIINVLDYLGEKFGIAIDTTKENLLPYIREISEKLIDYEICTSVVWIIISVITAALCIFFGVRLWKKACDLGDLIDFDVEFLLKMFSVMLFFAVIIFFCVLITQIFDIVECKVFPEKYIIEYLEALVKN